MRNLTGSRLATVAQCLALAVAFIGTACLKSTEPQPSVLQLNGNWKYTGVQTGPVRETLAGTLTISLESGTSFQGRLHLDATNELTGQVITSDGLVSGAESGSNVIDFDANFDTVRRHVGQILGDTISGSWIGTSPVDGTMYSGTFRAEREP
jgi:hypothetical protein